MKKLLLILMFVPLVSSGQQWTAVETVDNFGDKTGKTVNQIVLEGRFSNSATTDSNAWVFFTDYGEREIQIRIIEYTDNPAIFLDDWVELYIKKASNDKQYGRRFVSKSDVVGYPLNFSFGDKALYTKRINDKKWAKYVKKGKETAYSFGGLLLDLSVGDKINIKTESGSDYIFEVK